MKLLLVEPDEQYRENLNAILSAAGHEVRQANCAAEGFELFYNQTFDLVLSASTLDHDIIDFCVTIKRCQSDLKSVPLIIMSADNKDSVASRCLIAGATEVISKNRPDEIVQFINKFSLYLKRGIDLNGKVLYVEDEPTVAIVMKEALEHYKMQVDHVETAEEAFKKFKKKKYDLVITDVILPGVETGLTLVQNIRGAKGARSRVPILAVTAFNDVTRKLELLRAGVNDLLIKPVLPEELILRVRNLILTKVLMDELERKQEKLEKMALSDQLTGLYNRYYLFDSAPKKVREALRHQFSLSVLMIDIDYFKNINDHHGHTVGDMVLQSVATLLQKNCREEDIAARFGGEEFVVMLSHCDFENAYTKAESLRRQIKQLKPSGISVTASFGVAALDPKRHQDFYNLFNEADHAVYDAKKSGRNRVMPKIDKNKNVA